MLPTCLWISTVLLITVWGFLIPGVYQGAPGSCFRGRGKFLKSRYPLVDLASPHMVRWRLSVCRPLVCYSKNHSECTWHYHKHLSVSCLEEILTPQWATEEICDHTKVCARLPCGSRSGAPEVLGSHLPVASLPEGSSVGGWERAVGQPESSSGAVPGVYGAFPLDSLTFGPYQWLNIMTITPGYKWQKPKVFIVPLQIQEALHVCLSVCLSLGFFLSPPPIPICGSLLIFKHSKRWLSHSSHFCPFQGSSRN